jgi:LuxR family maltose regulon positive regulatory protein
MQPFHPTVSPSPVPPVIIYTLGCFDLLINGALLRFEGRGPRKPLELLSVLVASGPRGTSVGAIADLLWPDADGFDAYRALITTLHRLRRLVVHRNAVHFGAGRLRLDPTVCSVDVWDFEHALSVAADRTALGAALALYRGPFLADEGNSWVVGMRARLEQSIARATRKLWTPARRPDDVPKQLIPVHMETYWRATG